MDTRDPALVHPWFGGLWAPLDGDRELYGSIDVDTSVRPARLDGSRDLEIVIDCRGLDHGDGLSRHLDACERQVRSALGRLEALRRYARDHRPENWRPLYPGSDREPVDESLLFLDGVEIAPDLSMSLAFDLGDLEQLVLVLDNRGDPRHVSWRE